MIKEIGVSKQGEALLVTLPGGVQSKIKAASLRKSAMDAVTKRERIDSGTVNVADGIRITKLNAMGSTGINIHFSDGHEKAIYPYPFLKKLALDSDN